MIGSGLVFSLVTPYIMHLGYNMEDLAQNVINFEYMVSSGDMGFITKMECESGHNPWAIGDYGQAFGLCQNNNNYRQVSEDFKKNWMIQVKVCYHLYKQGVPMYGTRRRLYSNGKYLGRCGDVVQKRFLIIPPIR